MRVLILGGTTEASELAELLAGDARFEATLSLAGRTSAPRPQPIATRVGGFGGAQGLADFLRAQKIDAVIDATHPYAPRISANAVVACARAGTALASFVRPAWKPAPGDAWQIVPTAVAAALALGPEAATRLPAVSAGRNCTSSLQYRSITTSRASSSRRKARGRTTSSCCASADRSIATPSSAC